VNATTFLATATTENFALVPIKESANAENVFVTQNGTVQDIPPVNVELLMTHVSLHTGSLSTSCALVMERANVANANAMKLPKDNTLVNFVKIVQHVQTNVRSCSPVFNASNFYPDPTWMKSLTDTTIESILMLKRNVISVPLHPSQLNEPKIT